MQVHTNSKNRVRWLNPINLPHYDEPMGQALASIKQPSTELQVISLGNPDAPMDNLEYRFYEALVTGDIVRAAKDSDEQDVDALVIGCFYDLALEDCREICNNTIVVAPCQASVQLAANLANRFSVIVGQDKWIEQMTQRVHSYGYRDYLASMRAINISANALQCDPEHTVSRIIEQGRLAIEEDKAEALILGCTCNFGLYEKVQEILGVPVIDPLIAAFKQAENLAAMKSSLGLKPSNLWSSEPPPTSELSRFGLDAPSSAIGNCITFN
ncbi:aspartate/glutamate racemase family protein [Shewanella submarina]|uniref:Aspartate/glutamate racemase family protein n=1 Tax=Shewanella submarina TaxID=2016376 RepID=A0ABV7GEE4_9GAMM|nr:aspartate/glutamate racemase family protein [Shewanella submarina]MCL1037506.1 aspartate/glutamate racemase family protein [Shewanella submarina]